MEKTKKFKAVIFDADGTLLDSISDIAAAMNKVLTGLGYPTYDEERYKEYVGDGIRELVKRAVPADRLKEWLQTGEKGDGIDGLVEEYRAIYDVQWRVNTKPYEGIPGLLDELSLKKIKIGVLSNKMDEFTKTMVKELLPQWEFTAVFGSRDGVPRKPDPAVPREIAGLMGIKPGDIVFVGDSGVDMQTACRAGMYGVGVLWGLRDAAELQENGAKLLIEHPSQLMKLF